MSIIPDPRYCPSEAKKVKSGIPNTKDNIKNWIKKIAEMKKKVFFLIKHCNLSKMVLFP
jgi:hypothetical protein